MAVILFQLVCHLKGFFAFRKSKNNAARLAFRKSTKIMSLLSGMNFTGYLSNSEYSASLPLSLSVVSKALFHYIFHLCSTFINPLLLSGLAMRDSLLSQESAQQLWSKVLSVSNTYSLEPPSSAHSQLNHSFCLQTSSETLSPPKSLPLNAPSQSDSSAGLFQLLSFT